MNLPPTLAARLTPNGRAAIATILVRGPIAIQSVDRHFQSHGATDLRQVALNRIVYGIWSSSMNDSGEGVVVCTTAANAVELHCHGGQVAANAILDDLAAAGCQLAEWPKLIGADLIKRECAESLAAARTESVAAILMDQYRGALHAALSGLAVSLNDQDAPKARQQLRDLCQYRSLGLHLTEPWQVVLAGSPNVGKSSLINALVGFERAIVYDQPGTTRDIVTAQTVYNGWPIEFADTAGIRHASEPVEVAGVQQAVDRLQQSDLVVHVRDATSLDAADDRLTRLENVLTVINKVDQLPESNVDDLPNALLTSAITGQGVEQLLAEIGRRLVSETPPPGTAVPFTARQYKELESVAASLENDDFVSASRYLTNVMGAAVVRS